MAPQVRLELTTLRLTAECSAIELLRIIRGLFAARLPADGSLFRLWLAFALSLGHRLGFAARPASVRCPVLPYVREREKLPFLPLPVDPGNFLLSQAVPSSVPSAFGGLTSVFGMGTGGALQLSSPETFPREASLSLPSPHLQNCTAIELTRKHSLFQIFRLFPSRSPRPPLFPASSASFAFSLTAFLLRSSPRPISIAKLHASQRFHRRPIYLIVSEGSYLL